MQTTTERLTFRPTAFDSRMLRIIAAHVQARGKTPFVTPSDTLRAALEIAAEAIAKRSTGPERAE